MIICWDNLEKLKYRPDKGQWQGKKQPTQFWIYKEFCKTCKEPFLNQRHAKGIYCCKTCKKHTEKSKKILSENISKYHKKIGDKKHPNYKGGYSKKNIPVYDVHSQQISWIEKTRRNKKDPNILEVTCAYCGKWFIPKLHSINNRIMILSGKRNDGEHRLYCSDSCKKECPIFNRSKYSAEENNTKRYSREVQPELRQLVFERDNYTCQKCEKHQNDLDCGLHCHHFEGIEINPIESADVDNCITLCKYCHKKTHKYPCPIKDYKRKKCEYRDLRCDK